MRRGTKQAEVDRLKNAAVAAAIWFMKTTEYGEESVNYQNGDSDQFAGDAWTHAENIKAELIGALTIFGVTKDDLLLQSHKPPHRKRQRR